MSENFKKQTLRNLQKSADPFSGRACQICWTVPDPWRMSLLALKDLDVYRAPG